MVEPVEDADEDPEPTEFYTFWGPEAASRIDRFYVPQSWISDVQWVSVEEPALPTDHQRVRLHWGAADVASQQRRQGQTVTYPIRTAQPERVQHELLTELTEAGVGRDVTVANWDAQARTCVRCIKLVKRRETQRRNTFVHKITAQNRGRPMTRAQLIAITVDEAREELLVRTAQRLERSMEQIRWNFKRVSNWERDQTITTIRRINGKEFTREMMTIADRFGSEWRSTLGEEHNSTQPGKMATEFDAFVHIPADRKVSEEGNRLLMRPITTDEVIQAFDALNRHKAAGPDGLNNDLFKDAQALLVPAMVAIGNELLKGGDPPKSFLEGLIIPLRKKGDSDNAMDYRPISLLQTGYKVYTKIIATRAQKVMGRTIGDSQQGFVHGSQMMNTVMMMLAMLTTAKKEPALAAMMSRVILLLDFKKAYDTVARAFLFLVLERFGFSKEFVAMIRKLHHGTTARFLVNGLLSDPIDIISGIRQGCPLAPLLFLLAAEILALAIQQDRQIKGLHVPGTPTAEHTFSAFVDDATVFLEQASMLARVMEIVEVFGRLSGLRVQPTKSKLIFLNTTVQMKQYMGIPVLQHGDTVRYLGFAVGTGELTDTNWAIRIRNVQRRLATATRLATSVELRVLILNVIMLPAILFTAAAFEPPDWAAKQLHNLQKQFLWRHATTTETSRHKLSPALVYLPKQAGGMGLASITIACKVQRAKHALQWLTQREDRYSAAWRTWAFRGAAQNWERGITPRQISIRQPSRRLRTPGNTLQKLIGSWIRPDEIPNTETAHQQDQEFDSLLTEAISWTQEEEWILELPQQLSQRALEQTTVEESFWPVYQWADNPWIRDQQGEMLHPKKFARIRPCPLGDLHIQRTGNRTYVMEIPTTGLKHHSQAKLRQWGIAILLSPPRLEIGEELTVGTKQRIRHQPKLGATYIWTSKGASQIVGRQIGAGTRKDEVIALSQQSDGVHWSIALDNVETEATSADCQILRKRQENGGIVFYAHPALHRFPWEVPDSIANQHVLKALKKQPYRRYRTAGKGLRGAISRLQEVAGSSTWQAAALRQLPTLLWAHRHELTEYQVWTTYRVALRQLNLHHEGREQDNSCRKLQCCRHTKETMEHIFWACPCAQACWQKMISHWTAERWAVNDLKSFQESCASRQAPHISAEIREVIQATNPDAADQYEAVWKRLWRALRSICITSLWIQRNKAIFKDEEVTIAGSVKTFWERSMRQIKAIAKRERRKVDTKIKGTRMLLLQQHLARQPREKPPKAARPVQPPDPAEEPALLTRLKTYQTSCNH